MNAAMSLDRVAPGDPGIAARWTSSAKSGVGTAIGHQSRVWFTLSHGTCNEIYYPCVDQACVRDLELIVTDGATLFSEEKRDTESVVHWLADGVPAFGLTNSSHDGRYRIEKQILTDPHRDTLLQQIRFVPLKGQLSDYQLHVLLAPHLGNQGGGNTAWVSGVDDARSLFAQRDRSALALLCSSPWMKLSVGYVGSSDGWQDLRAHKRMTWEYSRAENDGGSGSSQDKRRVCIGVGLWQGS
jgi:glucoamylase